MANANNDFTLSASDQTLFDTSTAGDEPCGVFMVINRDTSIWAMIHCPQLHAAGEYCPVPPNQIPILLSKGGDGIHQVVAKGESGAPHIGFSAIRR